MLSIVLLLAAAQGQADAPAPAPTPATTVAKEKKSCRVTETTGSRLGSAKVCRTAEAWAEADARDAANSAANLSHSGAIRRN